MNKEIIPLDRAILEQSLGMSLEEFFSKKFKPTCHYLKGLDCLVYLARDCSYTSVRTSEPQLELLRHQGDGESIGIKILFFSQMPRPIRQEILEWIPIDPDDIRGIEDILILNFEEMRPEIEAAEIAFFEELRRRDNLWRDNALYDPSYPSVKVRHEKVMTHLQSLNPNRLPG